METRVYKISPAGINTMQRKSYPRLIITYLLILVFSVALNYRQQEQGGFDINSIDFYLIGTLVITFAITIIYSLRWLRKFYSSINITIDNAGITRTINNFPTIYIPYNDIQSITKHKNGSIEIVGIGNKIHVYSTIENIAELEQTLSLIKPFAQPTTKDTLIRKPWVSVALTITTLAAMSVIYLSEIKILVGICGVFVLSLLTYSLIRRQRNTDIPKRTKMLMWIAIIPMLSIAAIVYHKLTS